MMEAGEKKSYAASRLQHDIEHFKEQYLHSIGLKLSRSASLSTSSFISPASSSAFLRRDSLLSVGTLKDSSSSFGTRGDVSSTIGARGDSLSSSSSQEDIVFGSSSEAREDGAVGTVSRRERYLSRQSAPDITKSADATHTGQPAPQEVCDLEQLKAEYIKSLGLSHRPARPKGLPRLKDRVGEFEALMSKSACSVQKGAPLTGNRIMGNKRVSPKPDYISSGDQTPRNSLETPELTSATSNSSRTCVTNSEQFSERSAQKNTAQPSSFNSLEEHTIPTTIINNPATTTSNKTPVTLARGDQSSPDLNLVTLPSSHLSLSSTSPVTRGDHPNPEVSVPNKLPKVERMLSLDSRRESFQKQSNKASFCEPPNKVFDFTVDQPVVHKTYTDKEKALILESSRKSGGIQQRVLCLSSQTNRQSENASKTLVPQLSQDSRVPNELPHSVTNIVSRFEVISQCRIKGKTGSALPGSGLVTDKRRERAAILARKTTGELEGDQVDEAVQRELSPCQQSFSSSLARSDLTSADTSSQQRHLDRAETSDRVSIATDVRTKRGNLDDIWRDTEDTDRGENLRVAITHCLEDSTHTCVSTSHTWPATSHSARIVAARSDHNFSPTSSLSVGCVEDYLRSENLPGSKEISSHLHDVCGATRDGLSGDVTDDSRDGISGDVTEDSRDYISGDVTDGIRDGISGDVTEDSRDGLSGDVTDASRDGLSGDVTDASRDGLSGDVTKDSRDGLSGDVTDTSRDGLSGDVTGACSYELSDSVNHSNLDVDTDKMGSSLTRKDRTVVGESSDLLDTFSHVVYDDGQSRVSSGGIPGQSEAKHCCHGDEHSVEIIDRLLSVSENEQELCYRDDVEGRNYSELYQWHGVSCSRQPFSATEADVKIFRRDCDQGSWNDSGSLSDECTLSRAQIELGDDMKQVSQLSERSVSQSTGETWSCLSGDVTRVDPDQGGELNELTSEGSVAGFQINSGSVHVKQMRDAKQILDYVVHDLQDDWLVQDSTSTGMGVLDGIVVTERCSFVNDSDSMADEQQVSRVQIKEEKSAGSSDAAHVPTRALDTSALDTASGEQPEMNTDVNHQTQNAPSSRPNNAGEDQAEKNEVPRSDASWDNSHEHAYNAFCGDGHENSPEEICRTVVASSDVNLHDITSSVLDRGAAENDVAARAIYYLTEVMTTRSDSLHNEEITREAVAGYVECSEEAVEVDDCGKNLHESRQSSKTEAKVSSTFINDVSSLLCYPDCNGSQTNSTAKNNAVTEEELDYDTNSWEVLSSSLNSYVETLTRNAFLECFSSLRIFPGNVNTHLAKPSGCGQPIRVVASSELSDQPPVEEPLTVPQDEGKQRSGVLADADVDSVYSDNDLEGVTEKEFQSFGDKNNNTCMSPRDSPVSREEAPSVLQAAGAGSCLIVSEKLESSLAGSGRSMRRGSETVGSVSARGASNSNSIVITSEFNHTENSVMATPFNQTEDSSMTTVVNQTEDSVITREVDQTEDSVITREVDQTEDSVITREVDQTENSVITREVDQTEDGVITREVDQTVDSVITREVDQTEDSVITREVDQTEDGVITREVDQTEDSVITREVDQTEEGVIIREVDQTEEGVIIREVDQTEEGVIIREVDQTEEGVIIREVDQTEDSVITRETSQTEDSVITREASQTEDSVITREASQTEDSVITRETSQTEDSVITRETSQTEDSVITRETSQTEDSVITRETSQTEDSVITRVASQTEDSVITRVASQTEDSVITRVASQTEDSVITRVASQTEDSVITREASETEDSVITRGASQTEDSVITREASETEDSVITREASQTEDSVITRVASETEDSVITRVASQTEDSVITREGDQTEDSVITREVDQTEDSVITREVGQTEDSVITRVASQTEGSVITREASQTEDIVITREASETEDSVITREASETEDSIITREASETEDSVITREASETEDSVITREASETEDSVITREASETEDSVITRVASQTEDSVITRVASQTEDSVITREASETEDSVITREASETEDSVITRVASQTEDSVITREASETEDSVITRVASQTDDSVITRVASQTEDSVITREASETEDSVITRVASQTEDSVITRVASQTEDSVITREASQTEDSVITREASQTEDSVITREASQTEDSVITREASQTEDSVITRVASQTEDSVITRVASQTEDSVITREASQTEDGVITREASQTEDSVITREASETEDSVITREVDQTEDSVVTREVDQTEDSVITREVDPTEASVISRETSQTEDSVITREATDHEDSVITREASQTEDSVITRETNQTEDSVITRDTNQTEDNVITREASETEDSVITREASETEDSVITRETSQTEDSVITREATEHEGCVIPRSTCLSENSASTTEAIHTDAIVHEGRIMQFERGSFSDISESVDSFYSGVSEMAESFHSTDDREVFEEINKSCGRLPVNYFQSSGEFGPLTPQAANGGCGDRINQSQRLRLTHCDDVDSLEANVTHCDDVDSLETNVTHCDDVDSLEANVTHCDDVDSLEANVTHCDDVDSLEANVTHCDDVDSLETNVTHCDDVDSLETNVESSVLHDKHTPEDAMRDAIQNAGGTDAIQVEAATGKDCFFDSFTQHDTPTIYSNPDLSGENWAASPRSEFQPTIRQDSNSCPEDLLHQDQGLTLNSTNNTELISGLSSPVTALECSNLSLDKVHSLEGSDAGIKPTAVIKIDSSSELTSNGTKTADYGTENVPLMEFETDEEYLLGDSWTDFRCGVVCDQQTGDEEGGAVQKVEADCLGAVQEVGRDCLGAVQEVERDCLGAVQEVERDCLGAVQEVERDCLGAVQEVETDCLCAVQEVETYCLGTVQEVETDCLGAVQEVETDCLGAVQEVERDCLGAVQEVETDCLGAVQEVETDCLGAVQEVGRDCLGAVQEVETDCLGAVQEVGRDCLDAVQEVETDCLGAVQEVERDCLGAVQEVETDCLGAVQEVETDCLGVVQQEVETDCLGAVQQEVETDCLGVVQEVETDCLGAVQEVGRDCLGAVQEVERDCLGAVQQEERDCLEVIRDPQNQVSVNFQDNTQERWTTCVYESRSENSFCWKFSNSRDTTTCFNRESNLSVKPSDLSLHEFAVTELSPGSETRTTCEDFRDVIGVQLTDDSKVISLDGRSFEHALTVVGDCEVTEKGSDTLCVPDKSYDSNTESCDDGPESMDRDSLDEDVDTITADCVRALVVSERTSTTTVSGNSLTGTSSFQTAATVFPHVHHSQDESPPMCASSLVSNYDTGLTGPLPHPASSHRIHHHHNAALTSHSMTLGQSSSHTLGLQGQQFKIKEKRWKEAEDASDKSSPGNRSPRKSQAPVHLDLASTGMAEDGQDDMLESPSSGLHRIPSTGAFQPNQANGSRLDPYRLLERSQSDASLLKRDMEDLVTDDDTHLTAAESSSGQNISECNRVYLDLSRAEAFERVELGETAGVMMRTSSGRLLETIPQDEELKTGDLSYVYASHRSFSQESSSSMEDLTFSPKNKSKDSAKYKSCGKIGQDNSITSSKSNLRSSFQIYSQSLKQKVRQLQMGSIPEQLNALTELNVLMEQAWSMPIYGKDLAYELCDILRTESALDIIVSNLASNNRELMKVSARLLEQSLTTSNRRQIAENGLELVVKMTHDARGDCELAQICTGILESLFKTSEDTCARVIKMGGLDTITYWCRCNDRVTLKNCAIALSNLALYGGGENQQEMAKHKVPEWLFPLAFVEDDSVRYYALLAIGVLVSNKEIENAVTSSGTLALVLPFIDSHDPAEFAERDTSHRHGRSPGWLKRLIPVLSSKREEAQALAAFHFVMEAGIKSEQGRKEVLYKIGAVDPLKWLASTPNRVASKLAAQALKIIGEEIPHKLSQQVPLWTCDDVVHWIAQVGFGSYADKFKSCHVDGDLLLRITEEELHESLNMLCAITRKRFLRELRDLKISSDYTSCDPSMLGAWLQEVGEDMSQYTYQMLCQGVDRPLLRLLNDPLLVNDCRIVNGIHRMKILGKIEELRSSVSSPSCARFDSMDGAMSSSHNPARTPIDVFISYRRSNGSQLASLLKVHLQLRGFTVFIDIEKLKAGKFDESLLESVRQAKNFIIVLTQNSLDRCMGDDEKKDWVHREITAAIEAGSNIIPLLDNFRWPSPESLPEDMRSICYFNAVRWIHDYQDACVDKLEKFLRGETNQQQRHPVSTTSTAASNNNTGAATPPPKQASSFESPNSPPYQRAQGMTKMHSVESPVDSS